MIPRHLSALLLLVHLTTGAVAAPPTGFQPAVRVTNATRLDWAFAAGAKEARLAPDYDSQRQLYQLYVPPEYDPARAWPLIVFVSPGDDPLGWRLWRQTSEGQGLLFCAPYGAGGQCPLAERTRIVLDVFDDVRRRYRVDPDQTYLTGQGASSRLACGLAFALPEFVGGAIALGGSDGPNPLPYLRHRAEERLSVALVTTAADPFRTELEQYRAPLLQELGVRRRLWSLPDPAPTPQVLADVVGWLGDDRKRKQNDARERPPLRVAADEMPIPQQQAERLVAAALAEFRRPDRTWRGAALLQGVLARWPTSPAADAARTLLQDLEARPLRRQWRAEQQGREERQALQAEAQALERSGQARPALRAWKELGRRHPGTAEGTRAVREARRLTTALAGMPYLGVGFAAGSTRVAQVLARGPADRAGLLAGDVLVRLDVRRVTDEQDLQLALADLKPGQAVKVEVLRAGESRELTVELTAYPPDAE